MLASISALSQSCAVALSPSQQVKYGGIGFYGGVPSHEVRTSQRKVKDGKCSPIVCESASSTRSLEGTNTMWLQKTIQLPAFNRGCHIITSHIVRSVPEISQFQIGIANIFIMHTSASLTINENASSDVPLDMEDSLNRIAPEGNMYRHLDEGLDDMPAHVKSSLMGCSLTVPVCNGRFYLGTWQGIWLNEHRNYGGSRRICVTIQGQSRSDGRNYGPPAV